MTGNALVLRGDALHMPLPDNSVDLIITSPPYFALRSYRDEGEHYAGQIGSEPTPQEFLQALWAATREMIRVLKPTGSMWIDLGDKYAGAGGHNNSNITKRNLPGQGKKASNRVAYLPSTSRNAPDRYNQNAGGIRSKSLMGLPWRYAIGCIDDLGLILREDIVWSKPSALPESVRDRCRRVHEYWFHFTKQGQYFAAIDELRERKWTSTTPRTQLSSSLDSCQRCGSLLTVAGNGRQELPQPDTASSVREGETGVLSSLTESSTNSLWNQFQKDSPSTTSAETELASDQTTLSQSPPERTFSGVQPSQPRTSEKLIASRGTPIPSRIPTTPQMGAVCAECAAAPTTDDDTQKLGSPPPSVWQIPSEPLIIPQWAKDKYNLPDHFAAFPQEWPRRLILGWSPSGVCEACGEGRRPVVDKTLRIDHVTRNQTSKMKQGARDKKGFAGETWTPGTYEVEITGYACACTPYTDHPGTREPAGLRSGQGYADETGRSKTSGGMPKERYGPRREYHLDNWTPPDTKPAVILDPFGGTGTVAMVARALGRDAISLDLSMDYSRLAQWRIYSSGHGAKALGRTWRERQGTL